MLNSFGWLAEVAHSAFQRTCRSRPDLLNKLAEDKSVFPRGYWNDPDIYLGNTERSDADIRGEKRRGVDGSDEITEGPASSCTFTFNKLLVYIFTKPLALIHDRSLQASIFTFSLCLALEQYSWDSNSAILETFSRSSSAERVMPLLYDHESSRSFEVEVHDQFHPLNGSTRSGCSVGGNN